MAKKRVPGARSRSKKERSRLRGLQRARKLLKHEKELRRKQLEEQGLDPDDPNLQEAMNGVKEEPVDIDIQSQVADSTEIDPNSYKPTNDYEYEWKIRMLERRLEVLSSWVEQNGLDIPPDLFSSLEAEFAGELHWIRSQSWQAENVTMNEVERDPDPFQNNGDVDAAQIFPNYPFQSDLDQSERIMVKPEAVKSQKVLVKKQPVRKYVKKRSKKRPKESTPLPLPPPGSPIKQTKLLNGKVICEKCQKIFSPRGIVIHMSQLHPEQNIQKHRCPHCSKSYDFKYKLMRHVKGCHSIEPQIRYSCDKCSLSYKNKHILARHKKEVHSPEGQRLLEKVSCPKCSRQFGKVSYLDKHIRTVHFEPSQYLECQVEGCGKKFKRKEYLKYHMEIHEAKEKGTRDFCCTHCGKTFQTRSCLSAHTRMSHAKEVDHEFKCPFEGCGLGFSLKRYFEKHLSTHDPNYRPQEKEIICELCGKMYTTRPQLNRHVQKVHQPAEEASQDLESNIL